MSAGAARRRRGRERGQALLLTVLLVAVGVGMFAYRGASSVSFTAQQDERTMRALIEAREALIGRAAADQNRPGSLPCPDVNDDGMLTLNVDFFSGGVCASLIGRLPWRTLGLPDLRDGAGERLWYALSERFSDNTTVGPINSDTKGNRTVYVGSTATTLTAEALAVIFAPGAVLGGQARDQTIAPCPTTGTNLPRNLCAANYLEATGGANNATPTGPYIVAPPSATFNDRLLVITTAELIPVVQIRVARELRTILQNYKTATAALGYNGGAGVYPWADLSDGNSDAPPYQAVGVGLNRGRIPALGASPRNWGDPGPPPVPTLPAWFINNNWRFVIYYSAGRNFLEAGGCSSCVDPTLSVDGVAGKEVVILTPGPAGASRPAPVPLSDPTYWTYYLEDAQNNDYKTDASGNDLYVTPSSTAYTRDRIFTIP